MTKYEFIPTWKINDHWEFKPGQWNKYENSFCWDTAVYPKEMICCSKTEPKLDLDEFEALLMED